LYVIHSEILGGPEKVAKRIYSHLPDESINSIFIEYFFEGKKFSIKEKLFGKKIFNTTGNKIVYRLGLIRLLFFLIKIKPDLIHVITFERFSIISIVYKILYRVKLIYTVHGVIVDENKIQNQGIFHIYIIKDILVEKSLFRFADKVIFLSEISIQAAQRYYKINDDKVVIIPNGIDNIFYRKELHKNDNEEEFNIVFVGNTKRKGKGFDFLLSALKEVKFRANLYVVSELSETRLLNENELIKISFVNKMDTETFAKFLNDKHIFISASMFDSFSLTAIEAMAAGVIPVVTRETGMARLIINRENGFIYDYGDSKLLANLLTQLNSNIELRKRVSNNAKLIYNPLSWDKIIEQYIILYKKIIN